MSFRVRGVVPVSLSWRSTVLVVESWVLWVGSSLCDSVGVGLLVGAPLVASSAESSTVGWLVCPSVCWPDDVVCVG